MSLTARLALAYVLLLGPAVQATTPTSAALTVTTSRLTVAQNHGTIARPKVLLGYRLAVRGAPGARFEIYTTVAGAAPVLFHSGTIPAGGALTIAVIGPGTSAPHTEKVELSSLATARISATLEYY